MERAWTWWPFGVAPKADRSNSAATTRFGGDGDNEPVRVAVIQGTIPIAMAEDALHDADIPALIKRSTLESTYTIGSTRFVSADVWVPQPLAERARDVLIGIGVLEPSSDDAG